MQKKITSPREKKEIGSRIAKWREKRGLTNADIGESVGYSDKVISKVCGGSYKPSYDPEMLNGIARKLDIRLDYLLCKDDFPTEEDMIAAFDKSKIEEYDCRKAYLKILGFDIRPRIFSPFTVRQILDHKDEILQYCDEESKKVINDTVAEWTNTDKMKEHFAALFDDNNDDFGAAEVDIDPDYIKKRISWDRLPDPDIKAHLMNVKTGKGSKSQIRVKHTGSLKELKNAFTEMKKLKEAPIDDNCGRHVIKYKSNAPAIDYYYELRYCIYRDESFLSALSPDELIFTFKHLDNMARNIMIDCADIPSIPPMKSIDRMMFL